MATTERQKRNDLSERNATMLTEAAVNMFYQACQAGVVEPGDLMSALASIQATVILNVIAPHQRQMAVDDIARTAAEAVAKGVEQADRNKLH